MLDFGLARQFTNSCGDVRPVRFFFTVETQILECGSVLSFLLERCESCIELAIVVSLTNTIPNQECHMIY